MSRIGKKPIEVPGGVKIALDPRTSTISVEGAKGKLSYAYRPEVSVTWDENEKTISCTLAEGLAKSGTNRAYWGTVRSTIRNMIDGASKGFERKLEIIGVGWNAQAQGKTLRLNIGYCHPIDLTPPPGVEFRLESNTALVISGVDKQAVGQFAAVVRSKRPPEPYKGKGIRYSDEFVIRKAGKVFGK